MDTQKMNTAAIRFIGYAMLWTLLFVRLKRIENFIKLQRDVNHNCHQTHLLTIRHLDQARAILKNRGMIP